jgi:hypothetical protein
MRAGAQIFHVDIERSVPHSGRHFHLCPAKPHKTNRAVITIEDIAHAIYRNGTPVHVPTGTR